MSSPAIELQANCYLSKPVQLEAFENLVESINDFWLTMAKLPNKRIDAGSNLTVRLRIWDSSKS